MGQKGGGRPGSPGHPVQLPLEDPSISTLVPAASKGICQTPSHKGLSPPLSSGFLAAGGTKLPCGAGARAGQASGLLLSRRVAAAGGMQCPPEGLHTDPGEGCQVVSSKGLQLTPAHLQPGCPADQGNR